MRRFYGRFLPTMSQPGPLPVFLKLKREKKASSGREGEVGALICL